MLQGESKRRKKKKDKNKLDPWCGRCVYRAGIPDHCGPCAREGRDVRLCLVRILLAELDEKTRELRRHRQ